ncbi:MAG: hypothetical protein E1N59_1281 [Puniceicoccaceae bacterium 5H]|nr:MAG: hypothetical protein E1N59_1281 [Puniceicoccaceae bacterium 5H]
MTRYVAWLRGVNVGGHNKLPMQSLRTVLSANGFEAVQTYIQSGNIVFQSGESDRRQLERQMTELIEQDFGFAPSVMIITGEELHAAVERNPFPEVADTPKHLHVNFLGDTPTHVNWDSLEASRDSERYELVDRVFYLHVPGSIWASKLAAKVERCLGVPVTSRNWRTVCKVRAMLA